MDKKSLSESDICDLFITPAIKDAGWDQMVQVRREVTLTPKTMMLIDGRNRREACKIAGVMPQTRDVTGEDLKAFVILANINRRHLTKGQQAMAVAMIYPEPEDRGRGKKGSVAEHFPEISKGKVSEARAVLRHEPDLANLVLNGSEKLDDAYKTAKSRSDASSLQEPLLADLRER